MTAAVQAPRLIPLFLYAMRFPIQRSLGPPITKPRQLGLGLAVGQAVPIACIEPTAGAGGLVGRLLTRARCIALNWSTGEAHEITERDGDRYEKQSTHSLWYIPWPSKFTADMHANMEKF
jgi:hypothetical protein